MPRFLIILFRLLVVLAIVYFSLFCFGEHRLQFTIFLRAKMDMSFDGYSCMSKLLGWPVWAWFQFWTNLLALLAGVAAGLALIGVAFRLWRGDGPFQSGFSMLVSFLGTGLAIAALAIPWIEGSWLSLVLCLIVLTTDAWWSFLPAWLRRDRSQGNTTTP